MLEDQGEGEGTALSHGAVQMNAAAHHVHQPVADGKTEAGTLTAGNGAVQLLKALENPLAVRLTDADAVVLHGKIDPGTPAGEHRFPHGQENFRTAAGILDGVAQQIDEHLRNAERIAA